jgi:hypothetical protein
LIFSEEQVRELLQMQQILQLDYTEFYNDKTNRKC